MKTGLQIVKIATLRHKHWLDTEMRVHFCQQKIKQYAHEMKHGALFPPPVVFVDHESTYRVGDGFHRIEASALNGNIATAVDIRAGGHKDAILHNVKANREGQGLLFSRGDFSKSVRVMLTSPEFKDLTRCKIAELVGCDKTLVSAVARRLNLPPAPKAAKAQLAKRVSNKDVIDLLATGMSHKEVAKTLGVHERTTYNREIAHSFTTCPVCNGSGKVLAKGRTA